MTDINSDHNSIKAGIDINDIHSIRRLSEGVTHIFVDLDDTLWDFSTNSDMTLIRLYDSCIQLRQAFATAGEFADEYHDLNGRLWHDYHHGLIDSDYLKTERFRGILHPRMPHMTRDELMRLSSHLNGTYLSMLGECTATVPGAIDMMRSLSRKFFTGILSNGFSEVQYRKLYGCGLWRYVTRMVLSDEIGVQKPDIRLFDHALHATGASAGQTLMIGDNPDADIAGAVGAGWRAIYFNRSGRHAGICSDRVTEISDLAAVTEALG